MPADDLPVVEFAFPGPLRDQLVAAILAGEKITTTGLVADYENEPLPVPELRQVVVDSAGSPVAVIETTAVRVMRLAKVDLDHALGEGEGFTSVAEWQAGHEQFWHSAEMRQALGHRFHGRRRHPCRSARIPANTRLKPGTPVKMPVRSCHRQGDLSGRRSS